MKGLIIFYINVGEDVLGTAADKIIQKVKEDNAETLKNIPKNWGVIFLPVKNEATRVEVSPPFEI